MQQIRTWRGSQHAGVCALCVCLLVILTVPAQATKYAGAFMENGGGARALGMGGAFTAVANDASTTFWNPAGLASFDHSEVMAMHSERFGDLVDRDFASVVFPVGMSLFGDRDGTLGVTVIRLGIDDIAFTDHLGDALDTDGDGVVSDEEAYALTYPDIQSQIRYKSDQELGIMLSYGETWGSWQIGGTLKVVHQSVGDFSSIGIGADLGAIRPRLVGPLNFGIKLQDITTTYINWSTGRNEYIAPAVVPGFAWPITLSDSAVDLILATSFEIRNENRGEADQWSSGSLSGNGHLGAEVGFSERVYVRAGLDSGFETENITAGAGLVLGPVIVDYAYAGDTLDIDEVTHRVSMAFRW